ncbi:MAG: hypothetical protein A3C58_01215 [Candidatus Staskawiczbacteria bacterium RIFCSPHIGHO2_02_FULL_34_10]|uniref:Phage holin family protein n=1 Tax=Candidatus Staskawiczbacteria bacterium RIFCSPHIGHO2_02_FULL_34_10 TaxID=1802205 RepID=A0A1G2HWK3_9BACT|nr:MAG: hypothetical protein A3C58_01215 [Candidatus Staskawiczbacteria bacterium RIFCSPHIGHO2_02_FULL_34_10]
MKKLLFQIVAAGLGLWLANMFVPGIRVVILSDSNFFGIDLTTQWQLFLLFSIILGLLNFFVKPILNVITLPLRIITLGLFSFAINAGLIWIVDVVFKELSVPFLYPLLYTTLIIWGLNVISLIVFNRD